MPNGDKEKLQQKIDDAITLLKGFEKDLRDNKDVKVHDVITRTLGVLG